MSEMQQEELRQKELELQETRYEDSGIDKRILRGIKEMGFEVMTPIQAQAIPVLLEGRDVIGQGHFPFPLSELLFPEIFGDAAEP